MRQGGRFGRRRIAVGAAGAAASGLFAASAWGEEPYGHAESGQIGFQAPVTDLARYLQWFHNDILVPVTFVISLFVAGAAHLRRLALPREGESDAVAHHP